MIMPYRERLVSWIVVQLFPDMQRVVRGRYYKRSDAEGHLAILQKQIPDQTFILIFDSTPARSI